MPRRRVVIDSGPLVALFDRDDAHHEAAKKFLQGFDGELVANLAVLTEVVNLLDFSLQAQVDFLRWVGDGAITLVELIQGDMDQAIGLMEKYSDLPADFADVTLIVLSERLGLHEVASVDRDFGIYRLQKKKPFKNVFWG